MYSIKQELATLRP